MQENEITGTILDTCIQIHRELGPGLFESVYEEILAYELEKLDLDVQRQRAVEVEWDGRNMGLGFRADLIVESKVIIELKSIEKIEKVHFKQLQTYLQLTGIRVGLLVNFNESLLKDGFHRVVNGY
ncbi:MAG: GxxExxY protein [Flavobacteriales bacterium]|nr:GxxExxY protein [Flavobacteriales bacterium]